MEFPAAGEEEEEEEAVSPSGEYLKSSKLDLTILGVLEFQNPIDDSPTLLLIDRVFLPINPRFSSIMVADETGAKKWKRVRVNLQDHVKVPVFPADMRAEYYDGCFREYLTSIAAEPLPQDRPLWEIHVVKYPTKVAAGNLVFKIHHSLGDGYSLMGALLSCLQRLDDPLMPLTFPSRKSTAVTHDGARRIHLLRRARRLLVKLFYTSCDFASALMKSNFIRDDKSPIRSSQSENKLIVTTTTAFSLDQIRQIKNKLQVTVNDVITGVVIFGTRLYMQKVDSQSGGAKTSSALVLLNTRAIDGYKSIAEMIEPRSRTPWGNRFAFLHVPIPKLTHAELRDPIRFVKKASRIIKRQRNSAAVYLTGQFLNLLRKLKGPEAAAKYIHGTLRNTSMAISSLMGPLEKMALANQPIKGLYFIVSGPPQSLSVTMISYVEELRIAITAEKGFIDEEKYKECMEFAFQAIFKAALQCTPPLN